MVHLYREQLDYEGGRYRKSWENSGTNKNFQDYMYEDVWPRLNEQERQKILSNNIVFLDEHEKIKQYRATLQSDGVISHDGKPLEDGDYMFVLDFKKQLFAAKKLRGQVHHSTLSSGEAVLGAGMMIMKMERSKAFEDIVGITNLQKKI